MIFLDLELFKGYIVFILKEYWMIDNGILTYNGNKFIHEKKTHNWYMIGLFQS